MSAPSLWAALAVALLSGCAHLPGAQVQTVQGRPVEAVTGGQGQPTVVFENGLGATLDWWSAVWPQVVQKSNALAYNRAGYGQSASTDTTRDGPHVVGELRALLQAQRLAPPYVLVGHSLGGLYMQWFARQYPAEVAALVLVDSTHPEQLRGAGDPKTWPTWLKLSFGLLTSDTAKRELADLDATGQQVLALPVDTKVPVWVLSALGPMAASSPQADDANQKRAELHRLYPGAKQVWVNSGHAIPLEKPEAVVEAIQEALQLAAQAAATPTEPASPASPRPTDR